MDNISNKTACEDAVLLRGVPQTIEVMMMFDVETIMQMFPPKGLTEVYIPLDKANGLIYMATKQENTISGGGGAYLNIKAKVRDYINWRETTFGANTGYCVQLSSFGYWSGTQVIDIPRMSIANTTVPVPNPNNYTDVSQSQNFKDHMWYTNVISPGVMNYTWNFVIIDYDDNGKAYIKGNYKWDPQITVTLH